MVYDPSGESEDTSQIVESKSRVTPLLGGPAPNRHARPSAMVNTFTRLADMTPRETTQKRTHSRGGHHPVKATPGPSNPP